MRAVALALLVACALPSLARAGDAPACRSVEVRLKPTGNLQMAVWIEDENGRYVDTLFVTRTTGTLGLANRPGNGRFKSGFRFPYGRREMVLPVWAHKRDHRYGRVMMGGKPGNSIASCRAYGIRGEECDDETIGYHFFVSSPEPFYCSPSGGVSIKQNGVDVVSCASSFYGSKGAYADPPAYSLYPPRADLTSFEDAHDGPDARAFATVNDLGAISGATPPAGRVLDAPIRWIAPVGVTDGRYILKVEAHLEGDFNPYHRYPAVDDEHPELNSYGKEFLGQPSVVYAVPFTLGPTAETATTSSYEGYSDWDGATGTLHPADMTISSDDGTGAGRLMRVEDAGGMWRVKVTTSPDCTSTTMPTCRAPEPPTGLELVPGPTSVLMRFASAAGGIPTARFDVRYREGRSITDDDFLSAIPSSSAPPSPGAPGATVETLIGGLRPQIRYTVAVRAMSMCDAPSAVVTKTVTTEQPRFTTISGCFIATAAFGTPMATQLGALRALRDRHLKPNPLGALAVATYYALSPPVARALSGDETLRRGARALLRPLVEIAQFLR